MRRLLIGPVILFGMLLFAMLLVERAVLAEPINMERQSSQEQVAGAGGPGKKVSNAPTDTKQSGAPDALCSQQGLSTFNDTSPRLDSIPLDVSSSLFGYNDRQSTVYSPHSISGTGTGDGKERTIDPALQPSLDLLPMPGPLLNFAGISNADNVEEVLPPDTNGEVGLGHYVQSVNRALEIWDKQGNHVYGPIPDITLWRNFGALHQCEDSHADPIVLYDSSADRWLVSYMLTPGELEGVAECVAISESADPLGRYHRYFFEPTQHSGYSIDYPKFGVWRDAYYLSTINYGSAGNSVGASAIALQRDAMLVGRPARYRTCDVTAPGQGSVITLLPADMEGASLNHMSLPYEDSPFNEYFITLGQIQNPNGFYDLLRIYDFYVGWNEQTALDYFDMSMNFIYYPALCGIQPPARANCIFQPTTPDQVAGNPQLDSLGDRLMHRFVYRNNVNVGGEVAERWLTNHTVDLGQKEYSAGIRWHEIIRQPSGTLAMNQDSTYAPGPGVPPFRWMGSMAMDYKGNMALGYSVSSQSIYPSIRYTGREATDTLNTLREEATIRAGSGAQLDPSGRWGDYSSMSVDPVDDCTFWYTNEYYASTSEDSWSTRIGTFKFPSCQPYVCPIQFTDVSSSHTFYNFIRCLACKGIISGYSDGMFYPNNYVNRGQIAKFISNAAFLADKAAQGTWTFHDVPSSNPYYVWVERVANVSLGRNFIGGYPCGGQFEPCDSENRAYFRPYNNATRGQISKMISLAALFVEPVNPNIRTFEDVPNTNEFWSYIERLASRHIITGYPCGGVNPQTQAPEPCGVGNRPYFRWGNSVTRGQTAQIIARSFFPNSNCENPPPDIIEEPSTEKPLVTASVPVPPVGTPGVTSTPGTTSTPIPTPTEVLPPPVSTWPAVPSPVPTGPASTVPVP